MFGFFKKDNTQLIPEKIRKRLPPQSLSWEIQHNYELKADMKRCNIIMGQKPVEIDELEDFMRLHQHNGNKNFKKKGIPLNTAIFQSALFKGFVATYPKQQKDEVDSYEFFKHVLVSLSGVDPKLLEGSSYFHNPSKYSVREAGIHWSFVDEPGRSTLGLPLAYINLYTHEAVSDYFSLYFEDIEFDTMDDIFDDKVQGYSLLDPEKPMHYYNDFKFKK